MSELEIRIGGFHYLHLNEADNIISGEIVKQVGEYYLAYVKDGDYYYHVNEFGRIVVYSPSDERVEVTQEVSEGILFVSIDLLANSVFLFNGKPLESAEHFYVRDMWCDNSFLIKKDTKTSITYRKWIDQDIDQQLEKIEAEQEK